LLRRRNGRWRLPAVPSRRQTTTLAAGATDAAMNIAGGIRIREKAGGRR
jgi:hypothetical protein